MKWITLWKVVRVIALAYLLVLALGCIFQRRLMYMPFSAQVPIPPELRQAGLREVTVTASDGVALKAWHWPGPRPPTLLIFHGNAGDRSHRVRWMETLRATGAGVFIVDYRGYGGSEGSPSEEGLYRDAEACAAWLAENVPGPVVYVGESLGCGVAVELAVRRPPAALILQSTFTSAVDAGRRAYPFLPVRLLLRDRYDVLSKIGRVSCPVMVIHGEEDTIIPARMGRTVFEAVPGRKVWLPIPGGDHNDALWEMVPDYAKRVEEFLKG